MNLHYQHCQTFQILWEMFLNLWLTGFHQLSGMLSTFRHVQISSILAIAEGSAAQPVKLPIFQVLLAQMGANLK